MNAIRQHPILTLCAGCLAWTFAHFAIVRRRDRLAKLRQQTTGHDGISNDAQKRFQ